MIRWIVLALLTGCLAAQVAVTPAQNQETQNQGTPQGQTSEPAPAAQPAVTSPTTPTSSPTTTPPTSPSPATTAANSGFPLDQFREFSAIMVGSVLMGDDREAYIYRSGDLLRMQGTEGIGYFLTDLKSFETYGITRLGCTTDSHLYFRAFPFSAAKPGRKVERVAEGKESVDGHMCQVETVTISSGDLTMPIKLKFWEAEDLQGFPIRIQILNHVGRGTIQYKNVVLGAVDPTLFVRPAQCKGGIPQPPDKKPNSKKKPAAPQAGKSQP